MHNHHFLIGLALTSVILLGACSSDTSTPQGPDDPAVATETDAPGTAITELGSTVAEGVAPSEPVQAATTQGTWPLLDETSLLVNTAIEQFDAGNMADMALTLRNIDILVDVAAQSPAHEVANIEALRGLQTEILRFTDGLEKGAESPEEVIGVLREIAPILDQIYEVADVLPADDLM